MTGALLAPILALLLAIGPGVLAERAAHWPEWRLPAPLERPSARAGHQDLSYPDWMAGRPLTEKVAEIRRWHVEQRGWRDIGYHWVIDRDGAVAPGRAETEIGAHVEGHNAGTIGICLLGGYSAKADDLFEKNYTAAQKAAVLKLIDEIKGRTAICKVSRHNDYAAKACPGFKPSSNFATVFSISLEPDITKDSRT